MKNSNVLMMVEVAVFAALALLLDLLSQFIFSRIWPQGGSISIAMVPIFIMAFRWGIKAGLFSGLLLGLLQIVTGFASIAHPVQGFLDYPLAFMLVGTAGIFARGIQNSFLKGNRKKSYTLMTAGILTGSFLRFLCHFASGIVFFGSYAPEGQPVALYSLVYNGTYMGVSFILSAIIAILLYSTAHRTLFKNVLT
ncbi:energy-coupled thiamine transporter ThiT [Peribacillus deserti]|uniref:Energy-coupled thiamine transporter ThiT n=1 Tax=Peribacillus deserti TaxID=673318 RepID=A0A2N5MA98_9BACI|nr:energy-coupled thiamine transporter ThiT [Peribacillus deserti]PLT31257.1 energy-coupled thiamine transporter ThiT [Peribacillus deserti]